MSVVVVDTNVAIVANGREGAEGDIRCRLNCVEKLERVVQQGIVAVDNRGLIFEEYASRLNFSGAPGVGDKFFKHVSDHQYYEGRVRRIPVTPSEDDQRGFEELPQNGFDPSDRKFLAVALVAKAVVLNAVDGDWSENAALMEKLEVPVDELCPHLSQIGSLTTRADELPEAPKR